MVASVKEKTGFISERVQERSYFLNEEPSQILRLQGTLNIRF